MPAFTISQILEATGGILLSGDRDMPISELLTDSRRVSGTEGVLFFALVSAANNAHRYTGDLYAKGIRAFVIQEDIDTSAYAGAAFIKVNNTLEALQRLATWHRQQYSYPVIGITGSNGKTIVKEWLGHLLQSHYNIIKSPKSYNSQLGVPLSVLQMHENNTLGIFEAGISKPGEMEKLETIIRPDIGILTHIGDAHDEGFTDRAEKIKEKLKLFTHSKVLVYPCAALEKNRYTLPSETLCWSDTDPNADLFVTHITGSGNTSEINAVYQGRQVHIDIPFSGKAYTDNAITCWLTLLYLGIEDSVIAERFASLSPVNMRMELKSGINGCSLINDSYSNDIGSLQIALDFLKRQQVQKTSTLILSDLFQTGKEEAELYREVSSIVNNKNIDKIYGIGPAISKYRDLFNAREAYFFAGTNAFLSEFNAASFNQEAILLKGARVFEFERIARKLEAQSHGTVLEINLSAAEHNYKYFKSLLDPGTKIMAMVKAFAYGSGSFEMAKMLEFHHVDYLAVAYADEGEALRRAGISRPIMVMNPDETVFDKLLSSNLEPEVYSLQQLEQLIAFVNGKELNIHIEFDTGMHRLGFGEHDTEALSTLLKTHPNIKAVSVFSHLSASDEAQHDNFTRLQCERFRAAAEKLESLTGQKYIKHILNTSGILRFPEAHFDMVRLGIGLYGIDPSSEFQDKLETVFTLKSSVSQVRTIAANDSVGYARKAIDDKPRSIAVIAIGYADGLNRLLSNGKGYVLIKGKKAPITGNICMDMCMADVTGIDCKAGDEAIIFGENASIIELAQSIGTIPYEVLTAISQRVKRVYVGE